MIVPRSWKSYDGWLRCGQGKLGLTDWRTGRLTETESTKPIIPKQVSDKKGTNNPEGFIQPYSKKKIVAKGQIAHNEKFLLSATMFLTPSNNSSF